MSTVIIHMLSAFVLSLGVMSAQFIDLDHLPAVIKYRAWDQLDCIGRFENCKPGTKSLAPERSLFKFVPEVPLHNAFFLGLIVIAGALVAVAYKNKWINIYLIGFVAGLLLHFYLDGMLM